MRVSAIVLLTGLGAQSVRSAFEESPFAHSSRSREVRFAQRGEELRIRYRGSGEYGDYARGRLRTKSGQQRAMMEEGRSREPLADPSRQGQNHCEQERKLLRERCSKLAKLGLVGLGLYAVKLAGECGYDKILEWDVHHAVNRDAIAILEFAPRHTRHAAALQQDLQRWRHQKHNQHEEPASFLHANLAAHWREIEEMQVFGERLRSYRRPPGERGEWRQKTLHEAERLVTRALEGDAKLAQLYDKMATDDPRLGNLMHVEWVGRQVGVPEPEEHVKEIPS